MITKDQLKALHKKYEAQSSRIGQISPWGDSGIGWGESVDCFDDNVNSMPSQNLYKKVSIGKEEESTKCEMSKEEISKVEQKLKKKKKTKPIKICNRYTRGERTLFKTIVESGEWKEVMEAYDSFYSHFALDNGESFQFHETCWTNRIPGMKELSHKTETFRVLNRYRALYPDKYDFYPKTFILPTEFDAYEKYHKNHKKKTFVSKLDAGGQGVGIVLLTKPSDMPNNIYSGKAAEEKVVQEYLKRPFLLDEKKHDLRIFVTVVNWDPLVAFINEEGLARFCTQDYEVPTHSNKINENVHLSNYSVNKHSKDYVFNEEVHEIHNGSKRTLESYFKELKSMGIDKEPIWDDIKTLCASTLKAFKYYLMYNCKIAFGEKKAKCFHI